MAADRAQHVAEVVRPALERGQDVVTDRYVGSSLAYQGYGRGLPVDEVAALSLWGTSDLLPDVVVLLSVPARWRSPGGRAQSSTGWRRRRPRSTSGCWRGMRSWPWPTLRSGSSSTASARSTRLPAGCGTPSLRGSVPTGHDARVTVSLAPDVWGDVVGQPRAVAQLTAAAADPVHAYLLVGPRGSGKRAAARAFAAAVLSSASPPRSEDVDRHVRLALAEQHPDLTVIERTGASIAIAQAREAVRLATRSPVEGDRKVIVIDEMHLVEQRAPTLLKIIEEPPASTIFVLMADDVVPDLVTIASRCVRIQFDPVPEAAVRERLESEGVEPSAAAVAAAAAGGDVDRARLLATDPRLSLRREAWRAVPSRLDDTGAAVAVLVDELRAHIDDAQGPLEARHAREVTELEERVARYGEKGAGRRELAEHQKREIRRHRTDELRFGLATLAGRYRDQLAVSDSPRQLIEAITAIHQTAEVLVRNPMEPLLLQALLLRLPSL